MLRINGAYLYELGTKLQPIGRLEVKDSSRSSMYFQCLSAREAISALLFQSVFSDGLRASGHSVNTLLNLLKDLSPDFGQDIGWDEIIPSWKVSHLRDEFSKFEAVLLAELQGSDQYYATAKGGFDTLALTDRGEAIFPQSLASKVPDAISDVRAGARCIAFDLPTAAAFHLHRANEAVLRRYFDGLLGSKSRPRSNNLGDYLKTMREKKVGDEKVLSVLQSIKDLHRNPIMHPEERIETVDEALSLLAAIRAAIGYMLDRIESSEPAVVAPLPFAERDFVEVTTD